MRFRVLIKIGRKCHMKELRSFGAVFMQPLAYFKQLEGDESRGDHFEGSLQIVQPQNAHVSMDFGGREVNIDAADIVGPVVIGGNHEDRCNVFCMYSITRPTDLFPINPRVECFGNSFVMVKNTQEFIRRLHAAANKAGFKCEYRPVGRHNH